MARGTKLKQCPVCGAEFAPENNYKRMCADCSNAITHGKGRKLPRTYDNPYDIESYESKLRARYMEQYHDTIVAIGYADRQMAETLQMAGKVRTEL